MTDFDRDRVGACTGVAVYRIEGYTPLNGLAHGSLDVVVATCTDCYHSVRAQMSACGLTPYSPYSMVAVSQVRPCGERTTFAPNRYTEQQH